MTTKTTSSKTRQRHSQQYKTESLALVEKVGVPTAAKQLGLHESQLYSWRSKACLSGSSSFRVEFANDKEWGMGQDNDAAQSRKSWIACKNSAFTILGGRRCLESLRAQIEGLPEPTYCSFLFFRFVWV